MLLEAVGDGFGNWEFEGGLDELLRGPNAEVWVVGTGAEVSPMTWLEAATIDFNFLRTSKAIL